MNDNQIFAFNCNTGCPDFLLIGETMPIRCPYCGIINSVREKKEEWEKSDLYKWAKKKVKND